MSGRSGSAAPYRDEAVDMQIEFAAGDRESGELLDVGRPPRPPRRMWRSGQIAQWSLRRRRFATAATVLVVLIAGAIGVWPTPPRQTVPAQPIPLAKVAAPGLPSGPALLEAGDRDELGVPDPSSGTVRFELLDAAPDAEAAVATYLPGFASARGGRPTDPTSHYRLYLVGVAPGTAQPGQTGPAGDLGAVSVTVYAARAPGTTSQEDSSVQRRRFDHTFTVRLDLTVFTGHGWWVRILLQGPASWTPPTSAMAALAADPRLIAAT